MGLISGFFFAGSTLVAGFDALPRAEAIHALQAINAHVRNWMYITSFFGALGMSALATAFFVATRHWHVVTWALTALLSYLIGGVVVTLLLNIPLNNWLASVVDTGHSGFMAISEAYFGSWRFWNWVRVLASLLALGLLVMAFREEGRQKD
jgi:uncharacterized membrane protein